MVSQQPNIIDRAIQLAKLGFCVFPVHSVNADGSCTCGKTDCQSPGKHPTTPDGHLSATADEQRIRFLFRKYPGLNIGIATGAGSGVVVVDIDGAEGEADLLRLIGELGDLPRTRTVQTGGGGRHLYFNHPGGKVPNSVKKIAGSIDLRGDGGYVVAPGSVHVSGNLYELIDPSTTADLPPAWLKKVLEPTKKTAKNRPGPIPVIRNGARNDTLFREAALLRGRGYGPDQIRAALESRNLQCEEPLPQSELDRIIDSVSNRYGPNSPLKDFNETDVGNAERLEHEHGDSLRYSPEKGHWFYWDGTRWREDRKNYAHRLAQETIRYTIGVGGIVALWGKETEKRGGIARMLKEARVFPGIAVSMAEFDQSPWLLNVENGTLDLKSDLFYAHDRTDLITKLAGVSFDPAAMAPRWEQLISEIFGGDEDLIRYVQRALGYTLTGNTKEEVMWITYGRGANGKSTLLRTIRRLLGDYGTTANFATFEADNKSQTGNELATLQGSRFVMATESENERRLAEARVKAITGGDSISVRFLYSEWFEYTPQYKIWLAVNHKPVIRGTDHGIWRRIHLIPFLQTFEVGKERNLDETLESEFPGILNWLLAGLRDWRENGLNPPESVLAATREYREESDPLGEWLERLEKDIEKRETATDLYRDYKQWMIDRMEDKFALSMKSFSIQLAEKGFEKSRTKQGVRFHGLALPPVKPVSATKGD